MNARAVVQVIFAAAIAACVLSCKKTPPATVLQPEDLAQNEFMIAFDPDEIIDPAAFSDSQGLRAIDIQTFLVRPPYNSTASFLATYESNGVTAVDAIANAATEYQINPLLLLVASEAAQGLVGATSYPSPASRVEYAFGCGCVGDGVCDPELAGYDKQVSCLAQSLRASMDQITANASTAGGWGPMITQTTIDGIAVVPDDASTAAIYQYLPLVAVNHGGTWLIWNIWQFYVFSIGYAEPQM